MKLVKCYRIWVLRPRDLDRLKKIDVQETDCGYSGEHGGRRDDAPPSVGTFESGLLVTA